MAISQVFTGSAITALGIGSLAMLPLVWRGYLGRRGAGGPNHMGTHGQIGMFWWPFGEATRRGAIRAFVPGLLVLWGAVAAYWASAARGDSTGQAPHADGVVQGIVVICGIGFLLVLTVMFFNWPKFIVPPPQRNEPGALAEMRDNRQGRLGK